jgi:creatinine amidohydrolase
MTKSRFWADLTTRDFAGLDPASTVAVLPLACLPQLPAELPVLVLPTQCVGYSPEHAAFPGTLSLSSATVAANWIEIGQSVARAGLKKLLLLNAHGGQVSLMDIVARELRGRANMIVYSCSWWNLPLGDAVTSLFSADEHRFGVHAGEIETSLMLALRAQHVDMTQARDFKSTSQQRAAGYPILGNGKSAKLGWHMQDYNAEGAAGNAAAATAEKGRAVLDAAARQLALLLQELSKLPLSTLVDKPAT